MPEPKFTEILKSLPRDDCFKATVYAMNTLLLHKGIYTSDEFEQLFVEWAKSPYGKEKAMTSSQPSAPQAPMSEHPEAEQEKSRCLCIWDVSEQCPIHGHHSFAKER